ncbi:MAG: hypothetical protein EAZ37_15365 [Burkholderiales bacterium]|nr:MAG: hypothetical protein EAZ37_15365 [Burkholderiales bacterium]
MSSEWLRQEFYRMSALTTIPAETIGRLNRKFFGRRAETILKSPMPESRVFSKRFLRQMPDGRPLVKKVERNPKHIKN